MVQHKSKSSASKDTSSPSDSSILVMSSMTHLATALSILEKLQCQDGGFYIATQNLIPKVEYFQGGCEGDVLIQNTALDLTNLLCVEYFRLVNQTSTSPPMETSILQMCSQWQICRCQTILPFDSHSSP